MREIIPYSSILIEQAKKNRNNPTPTEKRLWKKLKGKQIRGFDFDRQKPINNFIVDFYCKELKLAIEVDGSIHIGQEVADEERQKILESFGISFLRFTNNDIIHRLDNVIEVITNWLENNNHEI